MCLSSAPRRRRGQGDRLIQDMPYRPDTSWLSPCTASQGCNVAIPGKASPPTTPRNRLQRALA